MDSGKKLRCTNCNKVIGILKKDMLEIKCSGCGEKFLWDHNNKRLVRVTKGGK